MSPNFQKEGQSSVGAQVMDPPIASKTSQSESTAKPTTPSGKGSEADPQLLLALLQLESQVRVAQTVKELCFLLANDTRRLIGFRQACVLSIGKHLVAACQVEVVSSVAIVDRKAPMVQWIEEVVASLWENQALQASCHLRVEQCPKHLQADWKRFAFPHVLWCPIIWGNQRAMGGIWLAREHPWQEGEIQVVRRLTETVAHAWNALGKKNTSVKHWTVSKRWLWVGLVLLIGVMCVPVRLSTLAPVEVVARDPAVVTAPLDGVIAEILVAPNTAVQKGETIFRYEDTTFRNDYEIAEKNLAVGFMEYRKVTQGAFLDDESGANMPVQASEVRLKEAERDYSWEVLQHVEVKAPRDGIVLFGDKSDWVGKPVVIGERIMEVANPREYELKIDLPVEDAIVLREGADVDVFLNADPLQAIPARLTHASYHADVLPTNELAYRVKAEVTEPPDAIRIGWQGTAKVYGDRVSLFFYLFRRPLSVFRQTIGW
jgi:multidrug efflux pump subunit AcrA (membrane-fusion protein)